MVAVDAPRFKTGPKVIPSITNGVVPFELLHVEPFDLLGPIVGAGSTGRATAR